jgi:hypothetical protein
MFQKPVSWVCSVDSFATISFLQAKGSSQSQWVVGCVVALPFRLFSIEGFSPFCLAYRSNSFQFRLMVRLSGYRSDSFLRVADAALKHPLYARGYQLCQMLPTGSVVADERQSAIEAK